MESSSSGKRRMSLSTQAPAPSKRPALQHTGGLIDHHARVTETARALNPVHIDPEQFRTQIQEAVDNALSPHFRQYTVVRCLLLSWEADNLGCIQEIEELQNLLEQKYAFQCDNYQIPSRDSERQLRLKLIEIDRQIGENDLFILYYGGHAEKPDSYDDFFWTATDESSSPWLNWPQFQKIVTQMPSDALLVLDCCYAGHAVRETIPGKKEVIAASGWDATAVGGVEDKSSFTAFLIWKLDYFADSALPFTTSELFAQMMPHQRGPKGERLTKTPLHCALPCQEVRRPILLRPQRTELHTSAQEYVSRLHESRMASYPRMIVAVSFSEGFENKTAESIRRWLAKDIPKEIGKVCITVEMAARSNSTVIVLTMPIALWMALSAHPALRPCGVVTEPHLAAVVQPVLTIQKSMRRWKAMRLYKGDKTDINALQTASERRDIVAVQTLLDAGAEVNAQGGYYGNALQAASQTRDIRVVGILLDAGAEVNAQGGYYGNALQAASQTGDIRVVGMLLDAGAEVNAQGGYYGNALQAASQIADIRVVGMLLQAGVEVNAQGGYYGSALQAASYRSDIRVVGMLLEAGAVVNAQGGYYGNALQAASCGNDRRVVSTLLRVGAEVNAQGGYYSNALQAASASGHDEAVELLLAKGADVNAQGGYYGNALQAALASGHEKIVEILLGKGANQKGSI